MVYEIICEADTITPLSKLHTPLCLRRLVYAMQTVVITGGSRGIGAAAVELFAARGDRVFFLYEKNHEAAKAVAE